MTLYELTGAMLDIYERMSEQPPEDPEERETWEQALNDTLGMIADDFADKAEGYGKVLKQLKADAEAVKTEKMRLARRQQTIENNIKRMKEALKMAMETAGTDQLEAGAFTIKLQKNGGLQPLKITGEVPDNMTKVIVEPDTDRIREFLKDNECEWAHLEERGKHIVIK